MSHGFSIWLVVAIALLNMTTGLIQHELVCITRQLRRIADALEKKP